MSIKYLSMTRSRRVERKLFILCIIHQSYTSLLWQHLSDTVVVEVILKLIMCLQDALNDILINEKVVKLLVLYHNRS